MNLSIWSAVVFVFLSSATDVPLQDAIREARSVSWTTSRLPGLWNGRQTDTQQWEWYDSREGKYLIRFPGKPSNGLEPIGTASPSSVAYTSFVRAPSGFYSLVYFDIPSAKLESTGVKELLDEARDWLVKRGPLEKESEKDIVWMKHQGRELSMPLFSERQIIRILLVKQRVYTLSIAFSEQESPETARFFESFTPITLTEGGIKNRADVTQSENQPPLPKKIQLSTVTLQASAVRKVTPTFPKIASEGGKVQVRILISEEGQVIEAEVVSGPAELREVSLQAAKQWTFLPTQLQGNPVKVEGVLTFNFAKP